MVILTDVERLFDKIQCPIMLKLLKELRIEGICFQHNKGYIQQTYKVTFYKMGETQGISPSKNKKACLYFCY